MNIESSIVEHVAGRSVTKFHQTSFYLVAKFQINNQSINQST